MRKAKKISKSVYYEELDKEIRIHKKIKNYLFLFALFLFFVLYEVALNANQ